MMTEMINIKRNRLNAEDEILTHFLGRITSVDILTDNRIRIRILQLQSFNNPNLSLVNNRIIDCILPEIRDGKAAPYQNLMNWVGSSLPVYSGNTINLLDLKDCSVIATVKPKYIKKTKRYDTVIRNLIIMSLD